MSNENSILDGHPYYNYVLFDPRDHSVFYVGKGQRRRMHQHNAGFTTIDEDEPDGLTISNKEQKIREIQDAGFEPLRRIIGTFKTEAEAFAVESVLIRWVYGIEKLTNMVSGQNHKFIRARGDYEVRDRLEREPIKGSQTGDYIDEVKRDWANFSIENRLKIVTEQLKSRGYQCSEPCRDPKKTQDAITRITIAGSGNFCVRVKMTMSKRGKIGVWLEPLGNNQQANLELLQSFVDHLTSKGYTSETTRADGFIFMRSAWKNRTIPEANIEEIVERIKWYITEVNEYEN